MGENSKIEWTHHTFNPWIGCQKVSAGCDHCYAEAMMDHSYGKVKWGPHGDRKRTSDANWRHPISWNKAAGKAGARSRVFCASLADVFDNQVPPAWRMDLFALIENTLSIDGCASINGKPRTPDWIICGGESGAGARQMDPAWARGLRDECADLGIDFFMKQMTSKAPIPDDLMVRQFPQ